MATRGVSVNQYPDFARFAFRVQEWYGFAIGAMLAGLFGVGPLAEGPRPRSPAGDLRLPPKERA